MIDKILDFLKVLTIRILKFIFNHIKIRSIQISKWFLLQLKKLFIKLYEVLSNKIKFIKKQFIWFYNEYILSKLKHKKLILRMSFILLITILITSIYFLGPKVLNSYRSDNNSLSFVEYNTNTNSTVKEEVTPTPTPVSSQEVVIDNSYGWPTVEGYYITTYFSYYHDGIDIAGCGYNSSIFAIYRGEVVTSSYTSTNGNYIVIRDDNGVYSMYAHLASRYVMPGQRVEKGTVIGGMGSTGRATGTHLHFSTWYGYPYYGGRAFNPYNLY